MRTFLFALPLLVIACGTPGTSGTADHVQDSLKAIARADSLRKDSLRDGHHTVHGPGGIMTMEGNMQHGKRHGVWTSYTKNGRVKSRSEYAEGILQGPTITFHDNGAVYYQGQYLNGKEFGEWSFYDEQGALIRTAVFDSTGKEVRPK